MLMFDSWIGIKIEILFLTDHCASTILPLKVKIRTYRIYIVINDMKVFISTHLNLQYYSTLLLLHNILHWQHH